MLEPPPSHCCMRCSWFDLGWFWNKKSFWSKDYNNMQSVQIDSLKKTDLIKCNLDVIGPFDFYFETWSILFFLKEWSIWFLSLRYILISCQLMFYN